MSQIANFLYDYIIQKRGVIFFPIYIRKVESFVKIICLLQFIILSLEAFKLKHLKCLFISFNNHVLFKTFFGSMDQY
ncbi:hypothetical protein SAMN04487899_10217 [Segatella bryantii]|nr:hypothetical protein SAMN04487899_10217 [Segatella bryantii]